MKALFRYLKEELETARDGLVFILSFSASAFVRRKNFHKKEGQNYFAYFLFLMNSKKTGTSLIKSN